MVASPSLPSMPSLITPPVPAALPHFHGGSHADKATSGFICDSGLAVRL